ncbi:hypothetical protein B9N43_14320 [Denitratisoma sp. DHT3]|uniref:hypothetical protein n=1 Tax=Denitratisoma sp. DHT3 TaxID=1981880 RepID=UPI001198A83F|nr:hypothetical protein [Denitratisoma sp. DHT3]QDX82310.1 hypothetical protein B9N43_14320 [Denitratisoma sp. DHT3]
MDERLRAVEAQIRTTSAYQRAAELLESEERLEAQLRDIERELETLAAAAQLARIDRLRKALTNSDRIFAQMG